MMFLQLVAAERTESTTERPHTAHLVMRQHEVLQSQSWFKNRFYQAHLAEPAKHEHGIGSTLRALDRATVERGNRELQR
jgi:hypothetical protein